MKEPVASFHTVNMCGTTFRVDSETRTEIEAFLREKPGPTEFILVDSLEGEEMTVIGHFVSGIWSSTPEQRAAGRAYDRMFKAEIPIDEQLRS